MASPVSWGGDKVLPVPSLVATGLVVGELNSGQQIARAPVGPDVEAEPRDLTSSYLSGRLASPWRQSARSVENLRLKPWVNEGHIATGRA